MARRLLQGVVRMLRGGRAPQPQVPIPQQVAAPGVVAPLTEARFTAGSHTGAQGTRPYWLFVPPTKAAAGRARLPLLVMLHGCQQDPQDFAAGTRMNEHAATQGFAVLYPGQVPSANASGCWNWFDPGSGEPALLAGMIGDVVAREGFDPGRVFVAGLSAGGAMAAMLVAAYPDRFAGLGVHSGLPPQAAHDVISAFTAMRHGPLRKLVAPAAGASHTTPTIVFHGDHDQVVHPSNGEAVIAWGGVGQLREAADLQGQPELVQPTVVESGRVPRGHAYTRTLHLDAHGRPWAEHWLVHEAGHAWSGGSAAGSYTDPMGPDASAAMLRFFASLRGGDEA